MEATLQIVYITIPALIVFAAVYFTFRQYFSQQYQLELLRMKKSAEKETLPVRLQAYERVVMLCERISIDLLFYRISHPDMQGQELKTAMLIAIQQEYEHNLTQQLYVSPELWQIIHTAKEHMQEVVAASSGQTQTEFMAALRENLTKLGGNPLMLARSAIRNEMRLLF
ncbi:MAG: hypothetical protein LW630_07235 [Saprospiraceae bacterium]|jgi:hypothetical protein|nr:hypothetical protein [Saprospiraceae bacterium]